VLRLAVAVPYVVLADLTYGVARTSKANDALHRQATGLQWAGGQLGWVAHAYPPLPLAVARLLPGAGQALAIAGALCTGVLIQLTIERLILRSVPTTTAIALTAAVAATPVFWYLATQDFAAFLTLSLLSVALTGLLDFTFNRTTQSGFIAGIGFGLATLCDLAALPFAVAGALATLFVAPRVHATREVARRRAAATVVLFPSAAAVAGWAFLQWRFSGSWTKSFTLANPELFRFPGGAWGSLTRAVASVGHDLAFAPLLVIGAAMLFARRPAAALAVVSLVACVVGDLWFGAHLSDPTIVILLAVVGLVLIPERPTTSEQVLLWVGMGLQVTVAFVGLHFGLGQVDSWLHHIGSTGPFGH
jgi:hypothetical protein